MSIREAKVGSTVIGLDYAKHLERGKVVAVASRSVCVTLGCSGHDVLKVWELDALYATEEEALCHAASQLQREATEKMNSAQVRFKRLSELQQAKLAEADSNEET